MKVVVGLVLVCVLLLLGCTSAPQQDSNKLSVIATFYPFYDITKTIGGDKINLTAIVPPTSGVEPHDYEPTPNDIITLHKANVFVTTGVEFAQFEDDLVQSIDKNILVIKSGEGITQIESPEALKEENPLYTFDPHIWISPKNAIVITQNIEKGLAKADPKNADYYQQNAENFISKLQQLDADFTKRLSNCNKHVALTSHAAFGYLARDYNFTQDALIGLSADTEPTTGQITTMVQEAKDNNIRYIFYEDLVDPKVSEVIAQEVGAQTLLLSPLEGVTSEDSNETYLSLMRINLDNLEVALECQK